MSHGRLANLGDDAGKDGIPMRGDVKILKIESGKHIKTSLLEAERHSTRPAKKFD